MNRQRGNIRDNFTPPGEITALNGIPTAITEDHNEVYYHWENSGLTGATLFHIDAHTDMRGAAPTRDHIRDKRKYFFMLDIDTFIPPAFHHGIVSQMYWFNPHSGVLQYMGSNSPDENERRIWTYETRRYFVYNHIVFSTDARDPPLFDKDSNYQGIRKGVEDVKLGDRPLILDIDLDAFSCSKPGINGVSENYRQQQKGIANYDERIDATMDMLARIPRRPDLITLTLSKGKRIHLRKSRHFRTCGEKQYDSKRDRDYFITPGFVPQEFLQDIKGKVLGKLEKIYV